MLAQLEERRVFLEDPTGAIPLGLSAAVRDDPPRMHVSTGIPHGCATCRKQVTASSEKAFSSWPRDTKTKTVRLVRFAIFEARCRSISGCIPLLTAQRVPTGDPRGTSFPQTSAPRPAISFRRCYVHVHPERAAATITAILRVATT